MVAKYDRLLLRKVNIVSWDTAAWRQAAGEYRARGIPLLAVFDIKGNCQGTVSASPAEIEAAVQKALNP